MILRIFSVLVIWASLAAAQQPMGLPGQLPRGDPNADPNAPESKAPKKHQYSTKDLSQKLQKALDNKNVAYRGSKIQTSVDDQSVTLSGSVTSSMQHDMALQLVRAYSDDRKIIDKLTIQ